MGAVEYVVWLLQTVPAALPPAIVYLALGIYPYLGHFFVDHKPPETATKAFLLNLGVWFTSYGTAWLSMNATSLMRNFKFNPEYPVNLQMMTEFLRCIYGVAIATVWEMILIKSGRLMEDTSEESVYIFLSVFALKWQFFLAVWGDLHFYFQHRMLHVVPSLYKNVHKVHHKSHNPNPWSGLSMHPVEHFIYFSVLAIHLVVPSPYWIARLFKFGLMLGPVPGHLGAFVDEHHYLHHTWFSFNYGSSPMFDHIFGSAFNDLDIKRQAGIMEKAKRQAELAGAQLQKPSSKLYRHVLHCFIEAKAR